MTTEQTTEEALRASEAQLQGVFNSAMDGMGICKMDGTIVKANPAMCKMHGYQIGELDGEQASRIVPPENLPIFAELMEAIASGREFAAAAKGLHKDGSLLDLEIRASPLLLQNELHFLGVLQDTSERVAAEAARQDSQNQLQAVFDSTMDGIVVCKMDGTVTTANPAACRMHGYDADEMSGMHASNLVHPDYMENFGRFVGALSAGNTYSTVAKDIRKDGSVLDVEVRGSPLAIGGEAHILCILQDISERKKAEEALWAKNQVFEDTIAALSIADAEGIITQVNPAFLKLWGYESKEAAIGGSVGSFFVNQKDAGPVLEALGQTGRWEGEFLARRSDGSTFTSLGLATSMKNEQGELTGYQSANLDVTEQRRAELALQESEKEIRKHRDHLEELVREKTGDLQQRTIQLEASNRELEAFAYSVSHDLRTPLRAMEGFSQALLEDYSDRLDDAGKDYLHRVSGEATRMAQLIDDLLKLSRVTRVEMRPGKVDLSSIARDIGRRLRLQQTGRQAELIIADGLVVQGDHGLLRQALENMLDNAWKFTGPRKIAEIEFGAVEQEGQTAYFVKDNGVGFDMKYVDKLFAPFQRLHAMNEFKGTGIGLSTVQRIIKRHGGRVWIESEVDQGTRILFTLHDHEEV